MADVFDNARAAVIEAVRSMGKEMADAYAERLLHRNLAKAIRQIREARGMTQLQLATKMGCTQPMVARLEKTCKGVSVNTLLKVAVAFDCALSVKFISWGEWVEYTIRPIPIPVAFHEDMA